MRLRSSPSWPWCARGRFGFWRASPEAQKPQIKLARITTPITGRRQPLRPRLDGGDRGPAHLRNQPRRQHDARRPDPRPHRLRRQVLLRVLLVRGPGHREAARALRRSRRHQRRPGLRRHPPRRREPGPLARSTSGSGRAASRRIPSSSRGPSPRTSAPTTSGSPPERSARTPGRPRWPSRSRRLRYPKDDPQNWALMMYRIVPARSELPVLQRARAARLELFPLQLGDDSRGSRAFPREPTGCSLLTAPSRTRRPTATRSRRSTTTRHEGQGRPRREVAAERRHDHRRDDQPGLLPDRGRHRADRGQRALRALLSGEASVLPRARRPAPDADPGRLHADDHVSRSGARA